MRVFSVEYKHIFLLFPYLRPVWTKPHHLRSQHSAATIKQQDCTTLWTKGKAVERYRPISLDVALWWAEILTRRFGLFPERDPRVAQYGGIYNSCYPPPPCWCSQHEDQPTGRRTVGVQTCLQEHRVMPQVLTFKEESPVKVTSRLAKSQVCFTPV